MTRGIGTRLLVRIRTAVYTPLYERRRWLWWNEHFYNGNHDVYAAAGYFGSSVLTGVCGYTAFMADHSLISGACLAYWILGQRYHWRAGLVFARLRSYILHLGARPLDAYNPNATCESTLSELDVAQLHRRERTHCHNTAYICLMQLLGPERTYMLDMEHVLPLPTWSLLRPHLEAPMFTREGVYLSSMRAGPLYNTKQKMDVRGEYPSIQTFPGHVWLVVCLRDRTGGKMRYFLVDSFLMKRECSMRELTSSDIDEFRLDVEYMSASTVWSSGFIRRFKKWFLVDFHTTLLYYAPLTQLVAKRIYANASIGTLSGYKWYKWFPTRTFQVRVNHASFLTYSAMDAIQAEFVNDHPQRRGAVKDTSDDV